MQKAGKKLQTWSPKGSQNPLTINRDEIQKSMRKKMSENGARSNPSSAQRSARRPRRQLNFKDFLRKKTT